MSDRIVLRECRQCKIPKNRSEFAHRCSICRTCNSSCSIDGCGGRPIGRGLCSKHYQRLMSTGSARDQNHRPRDPDVEYQELPDFPGYCFGNDGSVWSRWIKTVTPGRPGSSSALSDEWRKLKTPKSSRGYLQVSLKNASGSVSRGLRVHQLILTAFIGPMPDGQEACHNDGDRINCRLSNLRWGTKHENMKDKNIHGTDNRGSSHPMARLTETDVRVIRALNEHTSLSRNQIAESFCISAGQVWKIVKRISWKHIDD